MKPNDESSPDPAVHCDHIQQQSTALIDHLRRDISRVPEPRFQALAETSAEVLTGLKTAYAHYVRHAEPAWRV